MANPVVINPTLTLAGQAAAFNASNNGLELKITHVSFGKAHYDPTGNEVALVDPVGSRVTVAGASRPTPYQIRMVSQWREDVGEVGIGEIGFWAEDVLVFVWSKADGTVASYKTDGVSYVLFNDLAFAQVPAGSVSFVVDPDESVALAALLAHEGAGNAHPQYVLRAKFPDYQGHLWGEVGGTADAITLTLPEIVELTSYIKGNRFTFKAAQTNTGATTINVDGVGAVEVLKTGGLPLTSGSIIAGGVYDVYYDGANFQLTAGAGFASAEATDAELLLDESDSTSWISVRRLLKAFKRMATLSSPIFTGDPKAPTPLLTDNDTSIVNSEWVRKLLARYGLASNTAFVWQGNIDQINEMGVYSVAAGTSGTFPKNPSTNATLTTGLLLHLERDATAANQGCALQIWETGLTGVANAEGTIAGLTFKRTKLAAGGWTTWGHEWDSVNTPKMASQTDQTPGRMITSGSYGLGNAIRSTELDLNKYLVPGNYTTISSPMVNLPAGWPATIRYDLVVSGRIDATEASAIVQTITMSHLGSPVSRTAKRTFTHYSGLWSVWEEVAPLDSPEFTGTPKGPTAPRFDSSKHLANTEFVEGRIGNFSDTVAISSHTVLTAAHVGMRLEIIAAVGITLPAVTDVPAGSSILLTTSSAGCVIYTPVGSVLALNNFSVTTPYAMGASSDVLLVNDGATWRGHLGSECLKTSPLFSAAKNANGYSMSPSGLIEQWGTIQLPPQASFNNLGFAFPFAFPSECLNLMASIGINTSDYDLSPSYRLSRQELSVGVPTRFGFEAQAFMDNYLENSRIVQWRAIGK